MTAEVVNIAAARERRAAQAAARVTAKARQARDVAAVGELIRRHPALVAALAFATVFALTPRA